MLRRLLFRPKWQHRNPRVRLEGVLELPADDPRLSDLAESDPDPAVRRQAVRRLTEPGALAERRSNDADASVREAAHKRLCQVLSGEEETGLGSAELEAVAREVMDDATALYLVRHAGSEAVRLVALARTEGHAILAEVALADPSPALRAEALERIDHLPTLERVARQARGCDKRVARLAREKVDALRAAEERPGRQREVCEGLERLVAGGVPDIVRFHELATAWGEVAEDAPVDLAIRVEKAREAFERINAQQQEAAAHLSRQRELCDRAESLAHELGALASPAAAELAASRKALEMLEESWRTLIREGRAANAACAARFETAVAAAQRQLPVLEAAVAAQRQSEALVAEARRLAEGEKLPAEKRLQELEQRWRDFAARNRDKVPSQTKDRFDAALGRGRERIRQAREQARVLTAEFDRLVGDLESALDAGELQHAISLHDKARDRLDKLEAVAPRQAQRRKHLNRISVPLRELRDWRRYGVDQVRSELIGRMRGLIGADLPPVRLAAEIRGLQDEWRSLDRRSGPAGEAQWEAFSAAALEARKPCEAHFEKMAAEHAAHAEARTRFCDGLESALADVDPDQPDWGGLDRQVRAARSRWRELGGVEPARWADLDARFKDILGRFEARLAPERERERLRRERLISQVEALADEPDLRKAVEAVKEAQAVWQPRVPGTRRAEQALWKRFKAAGDAVFSRRDAERAEHLRTLEEQTAARTALCESVEALIASEPDSWDRARAQCDVLRSDWAALPGLPRRQQGAIERRFEAAVTAFARAEAAARARAAGEEEERWAQRARVCADLEALLDTGVPEAAVEDAAQRWASLAPLADPALQAEFDERFFRVSRALGGDAAERDALKAERQASLADCRALCLELEILAGIDSPPEFADDRLALQVQRLPQAMMSGNDRAADRRQEFRRLLGVCYRRGPLPPEAGREILARAERARGAFSRAAAVPSGG